MHSGFFGFKSWLRRLFPVIFAVFPLHSHAAPVDISYQIKAAYIYNILQFVSFPDSAFHARGVLNVCVLGEDRFGIALNELDGARTPQGALKVVRMGVYSAAKRFDNCNALYVVETERWRIKSVLARVNAKKILTISEFSTFIQYGGLIELFVQDDSIRFRINEELVRDTDFQVAAQLIQLGVWR
jgi:hypothetical protein